SGSHPLSVPETRELADFISGIKANTSGETYLIDMHGWEGSMVGDSRIGRYFTGKLGLVQKGFGNPRGFLVQWTNSIGIISSIMELPTSIYSHADVVNLNCAGKIIDGLTEIMGTTGGGSTSDGSNGHIRSGVQYVNVRQEPNTNCTILGKLYGDNPIQILAKVKPYGDSYNWYKIVFVKNGERLQAYVREDFVTVTGPIVEGNYDGKQIGWKNISGKWYYFNDDGTMRKNAWLTQSNGQIFYLGADGAKYTGTHSMGDETWIFNEDGILERKWKLINGSWHVYDKNGTMLTGWIEQWGSWYYFNTDGTMRKNAWLHQSNGQTFYLGPDGIKYVGKHTIGGVEYTFNSAGILEDIKKGWQTINGKKYYFDNNGNKTVDWKEIDGNWYYFNSDGTLRTNVWLTQSNGQTFYLGADGAKYTGTHSMGNETWIFNDAGILERKWKLINGSWHVYDKNGTMLTGWIEQWGSWYYFNTDGTMRKNAWL
ncbi:MAG: SH3 domain-containing protein, partial [Cetobacterium sp.]|uniref:SH3 domain-containing protein n=1 Tax=Cetobacterium sp. TaxID=2071632 RepID=UPI003F305837